jgi:hypothetical protein
MSHLRDLAQRVLSEQQASVFHPETAGETGMKQRNTKTACFTQESPMKQEFAWDSAINDSCFTVSPLGNETVKQVEAWLTLVPERAAILIEGAGCAERYAEPLATILEAPCPEGLPQARWDEARNVLGLLIDDCRWLGWFAREAVRLKEGVQ